MLKCAAFVGVPDVCPVCGDLPECIVVERECPGGFVAVLGVGDQARRLQEKYASVTVSSEAVCLSGHRWVVDEAKLKEVA